MRITKKEKAPKDFSQRCFFRVVSYMEDTYLIECSMLTAIQVFDTILHTEQSLFLTPCKKVVTI